MEEFVKERNAALLSLDKDKITETFEKYGVKMPINDLVFWAGVHKARLEITDFPTDEKAKSRSWLLRNGFYPGVNRGA